MTLWPHPVRRLSSFLFLLGREEAIDDTALVKLEKASLKFIFLGPVVQKLDGDGLGKMRVYSTMRLLSVSWPCMASLYQRHNSIWGMV